MSEQLSLKDIVAIVLGIAVLIFLIFGFSTGWGNLYCELYWCENMTVEMTTEVPIMCMKSTTAIATVENNIVTTYGAGITDDVAEFLSDFPYNITYNFDLENSTIIECPPSFANDTCYSVIGIICGSATDGS